MSRLPGALRTLLTAATGLALIAATADSPAAATATASSAPGIAWRTCTQVRTHQCATVKVPLDRAHPSAGTTSIGIERRRASLPAKRIGAIFINPGGPGEPATGKVDDFAALLGRSVTDRFDVVAVDPRGVGLSGTAPCRTRAGVSLPPSLAPSFPSSVREASAQLEYDNAVRLACKRAGGALLAHMTTADDARDLDQVRALMGESQLNFFGVSYGTMLGQTYAALFPNRVRTMALDGVIDPVQWTGGPQARSMPVSARIHSGEGAWDAVRQAYAQCRRAGKAKCSSATGGIAEWNTLFNALVASPRTLYGTRFTWADLVATTLYSLYSPGTVPGALDDVHNLYLALIGKPAQAPALAESSARTAAVASAPRTAPGWAEGETTDATLAEVLCSDSVNPTDPWATWRSAVGTRTASSGFNSAWAWNSSLCTLWPAAGSGAYRGPFTKRPATPILFLNPLYDPATSLHSARAAHALAPGSRLVTANKVGHMVLGDSACATRIRTNYLLTKRLPATDVACTDVKPLY